MQQSGKTSWWKVLVVTLTFSAPYAIGIYLTLRDAIPLLAAK
jgi:hypothetical protein